MTVKRHGQITCIHAAAIILDQDALQSAFFDRDGDVARARIDGILDELLDGSGRALHDLTRRDTVDGIRRKLTDHGTVRKAGRIRHEN